MSCLRAIKSLQRSLKSFGGNDFVDIFCEFAYHLYTTFPLPHSKTCPNVVCLCPANLQPVIRLQCCFTNCYLEATSRFFLSVSVCLSVCLSLCVCVCEMLWFHHGGQTASSLRERIFLLCCHDDAAYNKRTNSSWKPCSRVLVLNCASFRSVCTCTPGDHAATRFSCDHLSHAGMSSM